MTVLDTTPKATQARILRQIAGSRYPKLDMPNIAASHHMTLDDVKTILHRHGYPDTARMRAAATALEQPAPVDLNTGAPVSESFTGPTLGNLTEVAVTDLHPDPDNPRDELRDIEDLAASMLEAGLLQPVIARRHNGHLLLVAGHRRLAAAKHLEWTHIPCIIRGDMRPDHVLAAMLIENGQRSDLDPIEEARGYRRLKSQLGDVPDTEVARKVGRPASHVSNRLVLLALPIEEQEQIRAGSMTLSEANQRARLTSGRTRPASQGCSGIGHLAAAHPLATKAKARCLRLKHSRRQGKGVGGVACGECWESVIRADERDHLHEQSEKRGRCVLCDTTHDPDQVAS